ncbi:hypothetical protein [Bradyrhizobium commune]|uniref:Uncharacterized protein n=1 Tax=Bradyrhizobium commune TaxID=83627 RepID=A0A7S9CZV5_9BRAD|nr:hypothetical protein [Bradyrhizobium commune]QPF88617.1 hypothetical protein IC761_18945 [Bradyrhizobium commune]
MALEPRIIVTRAATKTEAAAKKRLIKTLDDGAVDLRRLIAAILELDDEVVSATA